MITGAQAMIRALQLEGVEVVFGYPGATICPLYDCLPGSGIRHILARNEQNAGHAASGYARISGRPGVCVTTSGPGATNLFTAIATAYADSVPLVCITGQVSTELLGRDVFQEVDTTGAAEPFTKYSYLVKEARDIPRVFKEAFHIASTGRPGPVLIDMPQDVQERMLEFTYPEQVSIRGYKPVYRGHTGQVKRVASVIEQSKRPLLCLGGGAFASGAAERSRAFCQQFGMPVVTTLMGIGVLPSNHPLHFGMVGQSGSTVANEAVRSCDLLVLVGTRVGDRAMMAARSSGDEDAVIVHIDIDTAEIGKNIGTTIPLVGDAGTVLSQLMEQNPKGEWTEWLSALEEKKKRSPVPAADGVRMDPNAFVARLAAAMDEDAIYVADVGQNQLWSARNYIMRDGRFMTTGGMGTMGYSLPAAIGAKLAAPGRQVVAACGDGAFQMSMMELATARQHGVDVKLVVFRNDCLGLVREIQHARYNGRESGVRLAGGPDVVKLAAAYDIPAGRVERMDAADEAIREMLASKGLYVLEVVVEAEEDSI